MSISDLIVVMKDGIVQQIGKPQEVYDEPKNLFVAKFLGTPPISVFDGYIKSGRLFIGDEAIFDTDAKDGEGYIAIRPEGFVLSEKGVLSCKLKAVEVMGRDISVVCTNEKCTANAIRAIISAENRVDTSSDTVRFDLKKNKVFVFDKKTEERIAF